MATAPIEPPKKSSEIFFQDWPPFLVCQTPPPVPPKRAKNLLPGTPVAAADRPPRNGPMFRYFNALNKSSLNRSLALIRVTAANRKMAIWIIRTLLCIITSYFMAHLRK